MVNLKNEINIKIDNSNRQPIKKITKRKKSKPRLSEEQQEDLATQQLDNLYYDNHALMTQHQQGQSRGSGGSIILPSSTDTNKNSYFSSSENNPNSNPNLYGNFFNSLYKQLQNSSSSTINSELNKPSNNYNPAYTDPQKITNKNTSGVKISFPRGRPKGSKSKPKPNEPNASTEEVKFQSQEQPTEPTNSIFDNPDNQPIITEPEDIIVLPTKAKRPKKTSDIAKKDKTKPRKGTVLRPDKNEEL
jgi:hypothetical protein